MPFGTFTKTLKVAKCTILAEEDIPTALFWKRLNKVKTLPEKK
jgi:hypothetical protein